ncbi:hypothetical protein GOARA_046_00220 [Gordonia araii NBRC 100433]|uniref:Uncharacterized protein n=1 Tax=Gordonia araii NBRC 100433 TaxID=1073574 RepID=G7H1M8_9ACTN|nr:hypothetical protein [Gordonia araii]NNG98280.1 hypothetical protein [Gordonia araii NBRC 100433]GAB09753.1 hypothetical protein GOARA_046_00220 [Gordonia araii NBRC 100433]
MTGSKTRTKVAATALAVATTAAGAAVAGAGTANAARVYPLTSCTALSPNIVDLPYNPTRVIVSEYAGTTYLTTEFSSLWVGIGYTSRMRLDYHNLRTHQRGTRFSTRHVSPPYTGTHQIPIRTSHLGRGPVRVVLNAVNSNAAWSIPAPRCTAVIHVR